MTLKLRVGKKGYIILPKAVREAVGIEEGGEVVVEIRDGVILRPYKRFDEERLREALKEHYERLKRLKGVEAPKPGELAGAYLEEEFEQ